MSLSLSATVLQRTRTELQNCRGLIDKLSQLLQKSKETFGSSFSRMKNHARSKKENKRKARQRKIKRQRQRVESLPTSVKDAVEISDISDISDNGEIDTHSESSDSDD